MSELSGILGRALLPLVPEELHLPHPSSSPWPPVPSPNSPLWRPWPASSPPARGFFGEADVAPTFSSALGSSTRVPTEGGVSSGAPLSSSAESSSSAQWVWRTRRCGSGDPGSRSAMAPRWRMPPCCRRVRRFGAPAAGIAAPARDRRSYRSCDHQAAADGRRRS